jgi:FHA domain
LLLENAAHRPMTALLRRDVIGAAQELEQLGEHERAAEAYALVDDPESQARALARGGSVDRLDELLDEQQSRERRARARRDAHERLTSLIASGQRREGAIFARSSDDELLRERGRAIEARRPAASGVRVVLAGRALAVVLGDEVVIGRSPETPGDDGRTGAIAVSSVALSRRHVVIARRGRDVVLRDLGSRNGTFLRGLRLAGEVSVGDGLDVELGGEVPMSVRSTDDLPGAIAIHVAGTRHVAPLGVASVGVGKWRLERGPDGWVELVTEDDPPAYAESLRLVPRVSLVVGDAIATERGHAPHIVVEG